MTRILADLPDDDIQWLDRLAEEQGKSRAAILREAVSAYRARDKDWLEQGFGLWARHGFSEDGLAYQDRLRGEWDPERENVRKERDA